MITSLYVHVPFCARKCEYCAFFSEAANGEIVNRYVGALIREMELVAHDLKPKTVFFGGGTPSLLNLAQWEQIFKAMERLNLLGAAEWTVECNPATVSLDPDEAENPELDSMSRRFWVCTALTLILKFKIIKSHNIHLKFNIDILL